jgi:superfamily II DNA or RNA helicase
MWEAKANANSWFREKVMPPPQERIFWSRSKGVVYYPRGMFEYIVACLSNTEIEIRDINVKPYHAFTYHGSPLSGQLEASQRLAQFDSGYLQGSTGCGKTNIGLQLVALLNTPTLFIVHNLSLLKQTIERVEEFLKITPGKIGDQVWDIRPFTVATAQTLAKKDCSEINKMFGLVIFDEAHHLQAETFFEALSKFYATHVYGLTATPLSKKRYLELGLGPLRHAMSRKSLITNNRVMVPDVYMIPTPWSSKIEYQPHDSTKLISSLATSESRNDFLLKELLEKCKGRRSIVVSHRIQQLEQFNSRLQEFKPVLYHNQLKAKIKREAYQSMKSSDNALTFATLQIIQEGFDAPLWDQLFFLTPVGGKDGTEQTVGRIMRYSPDKKTPIVNDYVDLCNLTLRWADNRRECYDRIHANIKGG